MGDKVEDMGEGMQCSDHPYRNNTGGICAFCLQEKLGKLVSSSKTNTFFYPIGGGAPSSSSSSPSFQSEVGPSSSAPPSVSHLVRPNQIPLFAHKKKKVMSSDANLILKRSRSVAVPRHLSSSDGSDDSPRKKSFWSFLHLSRRRSIREADANKQQQNSSSCGGGGVAVVVRKDRGSSEMKRDCVDENESPNSSHASSAASSSFGRKVARSRSVGCGSRSFSGDFLERISTGFGDCALRRVESQRENKPKIVLRRVPAAAAAAAAAADNNNNDDERINKERVKCGGIFGAFGMMSSSSSSSSSSLWLSDDFNSRLSGGAPGSAPHGRSRSWGWAFASPLRAFRPSSTTKSYIAVASSSDHRGDNGRREIIINSNSNTGSNVHINATTATSSSSSSRTTTTATNDNSSSSSNHIGASPSLLAVRG